MIKKFISLRIAKNTRKEIFPTSLGVLRSNQLQKQFTNFVQKLSIKTHGYCFSSSKQTQMERNLIIPQYGYMSIRNSQMLDLLLLTKNGRDNIVFSKNCTIEQFIENLTEKLQANTIKVICNQGLPISGSTPIEALLNRFFFVIIDNIYSFKVEGQLLRTIQESQINQTFRNLQLPLFIRKQIEQYCSRINTWIEAKYGVGLDNTNVKISKNQAKKIIINAILDPLQSSKRIADVEQQFQKVYWEVQEMLDKKQQAAILCSKMVKNRMSLGSLLILANIAFIWSGTYIFYSWDIIEPIAYFVSSLAGIIVFSRFFKIRRPFSLINYKSYMIEKHMPQASSRVGFIPANLQKKMQILVELQAQIKDYYLKKL